MAGILLPNKSLQIAGLMAFVGPSTKMAFAQNILPAGSAYHKTPRGLLHPRKGAAYDANAESCPEPFKRIACADHAHGLGAVALGDRRGLSAVHISCWPALP